jgi:hypothetical protein
MMLNYVDNCPADPNVNQSDKDKDGVGDVCDKEESRLAEKYKWLPWLGIVAAIVVIGALGVVVVRDLKSKSINE